MERLTVILRGVQIDEGANEKINERLQKIDAMKLDYETALNLSNEYKMEMELTRIKHKINEERIAISEILENVRRN